MNDIMETLNVVMVSDFYSAGAVLRAIAVTVTTFNITPADLICLPRGARSCYPCLITSSLKGRGMLTHAPAKLIERK